MFVEPSDEARRLLRVMPWLVSPRGDGSVGSFLRMSMVAPFTQLTFVSFDLQVFLFEVFHRRLSAKIGHLVGMVGVNFFLMAGLAGHPLGPTTWATPYALLLAIWYLSVARVARLTAWGLVMIPVLAVLWSGASAFAAHVAALGPWASPWRWMMFSAFVVAVSHAPEPLLPPRVISGPRWRPPRDALFGGASPAELARTLGRASYTFWAGVIDELWAAPRLLSYNFLRLMFLAGYAPDRWAEIQRWSRRAVDSGNPALDYVGIGGATYLEL